jgi:RNA polymerase-associated protein LEO1
MLGQECFDVPVKSLQEQHQYLYLVHRAQGSFEAQKHMTAMMGFRPTSTSSRTHKKLTATVLAKHQRTFKTKIVHAYHDPEAAKREAEKVCY